MSFKLLGLRLELFWLQDIFQSNVDLLFIHYIVVSYNLSEFSQIEPFVAWNNISTSFQQKKKLGKSVEEKVTLKLASYIDEVNTGT